MQTCQYLITPALYILASHRWRCFPTCLDKLSDGCANAGSCLSVCARGCCSCHTCCCEKFCFFCVLVSRFWDAASSWASPSRSPNKGAHLTSGCCRIMALYVFAVIIPGVLLWQEEKCRITDSCRLFSKKKKKKVQRSQHIGAVYVHCELLSFLLPVFRSVS